jgi:NitT/TauT family transport system substrate-binding protein
MILRNVIKMLFLVALILAGVNPFEAKAQTNLKKVRIGVSETHVGYLPLQVAFHKGFYKDDGIELEIILMPTNVINTATLTGQLDINGAVTGTVGSAVQGSPMKLLIVTVGKPLLFLVSRKEIKDPRELKGKKIAGSSPAGSATILAKQALKHYGMDPDRDAAVLPMGGSTTSRFAALETGVVDATVLPVPEVIFARAKGYNELTFMGDIAQFPQNGFGATERKMRESPDEVYRMVRATLRGLLFIADAKNRDEIVQIIMKQHKVNDRKLAEQMLGYSQRVITKEAQVTNEEIQFLIDLMRTTAKVTRPVTVEQVVDFSFLEKARKDLGLVR